MANTTFSASFYDTKYTTAPKGVDAVAQIRDETNRIAATLEDIGCAIVAKVTFKSQAAQKSFTKLAVAAHAGKSIESAVSEFARDLLTAAEDAHAAESKVAQSKKPDPKKAGKAVVVKFDETFMPVEVKAAAAKTSAKTPAKTTAAKKVATPAPKNSLGIVGKVVDGLPVLTAGMHELFAAYVADAGNWSGAPLVGGNVGGSKQEAGTLMHLKMRKIIFTEYTKEKGEAECQWVYFTPLGVAYAKKHGLKGTIQGRNKGEPIKAVGKKVAAKKPAAKKPDAKKAAAKK